MIFGRCFHDCFMIFSWFFYDLNVRTRSQPTPNLLWFFLIYWRCFVDFLLIFWVARGEAPKRGGEAMPRSQVKQFPFCFGFLIFSKTFHYSRFALRASRSCYYRFIKIHFFPLVFVFLFDFGGSKRSFGFVWGPRRSFWFVRATFGFDSAASKSLKFHEQSFFFLLALIKTLNKSLDFVKVQSKIFSKTWNSLKFQTDISLHLHS